MPLLLRGLGCLLADSTPTLGYDLRVDAYSKAISSQDDEGLKRRARAMDLLVAAERLQDENRLDEAVQCYDLARPHSRNTPEIERRIQRLKGAREASSWTVGVGPRVTAREDGRELTESGQTSADAPAPALEERVLSVARMKALMGLLLKKQLLYGRIVACLVYVEDPNLQTEKKNLIAQREAAVAALYPAGGGRASFVATAPVKSVEIVLKGGDKYTGVIQDSNDQWVKVLVDRRDFHGKKVIVRKEIESMSERVRSAAEINETRAAAWFYSAVSLYNAGKPFDCLEKLGQLFQEFGETSLMRDGADQKTVSREGLKAAVNASEMTCLRFARVAVQAAETEAFRLGRRCQRCRGAGWIECAACEGQGFVWAVCKDCDQGKIACHACGGVGSVICRRCAQKGRIPCPQCGGRGTWFSGHGHVQYRCPGCGASGWIDCPDCVNGSADCPNCRNGRAKCLKCDGKGKTKVTCPTCNGTKLIQCQLCKGTGEASEKPQ